jgi:hypothetical protein
MRSRRLLTSQAPRAQSKAMKDVWLPCPKLSRFQLACVTACVSELIDLHTPRALDRKLSTFFFHRNRNLERYITYEIFRQIFRCAANVFVPRL